VKANRAYRLITRRGGRTPASFADPGRVDHLEVVEVASGEALLSWDLPPLRAVRLARALRADLSQLAPEEFVERWLGKERSADGEPPAGAHELSESDSWV
jgi:hypothetical protein